jgi:hypothetical protein
LKFSVYPVYRDTQLPRSSYRLFRNILPVVGFVIKLTRRIGKPGFSKT